MKVVAIVSIIVFSIAGGYCAGFNLGRSESGKQLGEARKVYDDCIMIRRAMLSQAHEAGLDRNGRMIAQERER